ncbi:hypothetical protein Bbelb_412790 [Branchiostoma belcheri]|nr:hypothetical protein Bbelb_412790 [Branchiostoma belcheri]
MSYTSVNVQSTKPHSRLAHVFTHRNPIFSYSALAGSWTSVVISSILRYLFLLQKSMAVSTSRLAMPCRRYFSLTAIRRNQATSSAHSLAGLLRDLRVMAIVPTTCPSASATQKFRPFPVFRYAVLNEVLCGASERETWVSFRQRKGLFLPVPGFHVVPLHVFDVVKQRSLGHQTFLQVYLLQNPQEPVMSATDPRLRQIKIKTGVVKRIGKEKTMYGKEVLKEEERLEKFKTEGKDEHDIRKQEEVLQESKMMIPDCRRRLMAAHEELTKMLEEEADLNETEEFKAAQEVLEDASKQLAEVQ